MRTLLDHNDRSSSRMPIDYGVTLFHNGGTPVQGRIQDISFGGVYVVTDQAPPQVDSTVTLGLSLPENDSERVYSMSAVVVRRKNKTAGLMFDEYDSETIKCLRRLYHDALG